MECIVWLAQGKWHQLMSNKFFMLKTNMEGLFEPQTVCNRWREHFNQIANEEFLHSPIPLGCPVAGLVLPISEKVRQALNFAKLGKACGPDDIPTAAWRLAGDAGVKSLTILLNSVVANL